MVREMLMNAGSLSSFACASALTIGVAVGAAATYGVGRARRKKAKPTKSMPIGALWEIASEPMVVQWDGAIMDANSVFCRFVGLPRDKVIGQSLSAFLAPDTSRAALQHVTGEDIQPGDVEICIITATKHRRIAAASVKPLPIAGKSAFAVALRDLTQSQKVEQWAEHLSSHDALTNLANAALFEKSLLDALAMAVHHTRPVAVLILDIDHFGHMNDEWSYAVGDRILQLIGQRLREATEPKHQLARLGGDKFAVLLPRIDELDAAAQMARHLAAAMSKPFRIEGRNINLSISIGAAMHPADGATPAALTGNAWVALQRAKKEGAAQIRFFEPYSDGDISRRATLKRDLRTAVTRRKLDLHFQPLISCLSLSIVGYEALLRWTHPVLGPVSPAEFIPLAEEAALITDIGQWVLETACKEAAAWEDEIFVAVNLSPTQFLADDLPCQVQAVLASSGLAPKRLELEITEGMLITKPDQAMTAMLALRKEGVSIALDDFGTGYSSLGYLQKFPFSRIKIDKTFVKDLGQSPQADAIVRAVLALGRGLRLGVTAEGVETQEQFEILQNLGCDIAQGFLFSRAIPPDAVRGLYYDSRSGTMQYGAAQNYPAPSAALIQSLG